jgi:hypoxanthine phosphoribosyltransferase
VREGSVSEKADVLYSESQVAQRVAELGKEITRTFEGSDLCVLGLMKGSVVFMADLVRRIPLDLTFHLVRVSVHREHDAGIVKTEIAYATDFPLEGRDVLLVEDVVDTGITLGYLLGHVHELGARSIRVCALIDKPGARKIDVHPDWTAFTLREPPADRFLVGYGLGWQGRYRALPFIGTIPCPDRPGRA